MRSSALTTLMTAGLLLGSTGCPAAAPERRATPDVLRQELLVSPFAGLVVKADKRDSSRCPASPPPYTGELEFRSKYEGSDKARATFNAEANVAYKQATRDMQELESGLSKLSDRYIRGQAAAAACALDWLEQWAQADALLGKANMTGKAVRKWTLAAVAFNYLKIKDADGLDRRKLKVTEDWITRVARVVIDEHDATPAAKINNHYYWAGAAVGAAGIATQDRMLLQWALDNYRASVRDIDQDGVLPREMARRSRALEYHLYALQPLVMMAELGRVNGIDLYAEEDCALCRLVERVTLGVTNPEFFEQRTGVRQITKGAPDGNDMVWVAILARACPQDKKLQLLKARYQPFSGRRLGGNLTDVYEHISKELPNAVESKACSHLWR